MQPAHERIAALIDATRARLQARVRSALIINAALLMLLLWFTTWRTLRAGLVILLIGNVALMLALLLRARQLARQSQALKENIAPPDFTNWFDEQARFLKRAAIFENSARLIGFLVLGWGFWTATRNATIALLLGVGYPLFAYFGMDRPKQARALRSLHVERDALAVITPRTGLND